MLDEQQLLDAGFRKHLNQSKMWNYDILYQKKVRDDKGVKYFINVNCWDRWKYEQVEPRYSFACDMQFVNGCSSSHNETVDIEVLNVNKWTPQMIEEWAETVFRVLGANYYELDHAEVYD